MAFNDLSSPLAFLESRRSGKPRDMVEPGPTPVELDAICAIAARVPDHGKLAPWRFVIVETHQREDFAALLQDAFRHERDRPDDEDVAAIEQFAHQAPALVIALSSPQQGAKIPLWEQELSAGAACFNLLCAAQAMGYVGGWLTGWAAYSETVRDAFGSGAERVAGFVFLGSPGEDLKERPRPELADIVSRWSP